MSKRRNHDAGICGFRFVAEDVSQSGLSYFARGTFVHSPHHGTIRSWRVAKSSPADTAT